MVSNEYIDRIYIDKLSELCGESYTKNNSYNLLKCRELHQQGWSYKTIYFALIDYFARLDKEWSDSFDTGDMAVYNREWQRGQWFIGDSENHRRILQSCLENVDENTCMIDDEFRVLSYGELYGEL